MNIDVVFSGGGIKAFAFIGALETLKENGYTIERVGGTSAGAIIAALIAANYKVEYIKDVLFKLNLNQFLDEPIIIKYLPPLKLLSLYVNKGLYKGDVFERWMELQLKRKGIITFADIKPGYLKVVASDITKGRLIVIPDDLERLYNIDQKDFKVATAIRMSAGFPYFFMPKQLKNDDNKLSYIVDGGLLSNFPLWLFQRKQKQKRPVIGVTLSEDVENQQPELIHNGLDMLQAMFKTMLKAHDTRYVSTSQSKHVIFIPVKKIRTVDLKINEETKNELIKLGAKKSAEFLKSWSH